MVPTRPIEDIRAAAVADARAIAEGGFDAVLIQNTGDGPPNKDADMRTVAVMAVIGRAVRDAVALPLGVNVLKNGVESAFAIASAVGADFVRIKVYVGAVIGSEGVTEGAASEALACRHRMGLEHVEIIADVVERTSHQLVQIGVAELADWAVRHGRADALVVGGHTAADTLSLLRAVRTDKPDAPLVVGGGATTRNIASLFEFADAAIVGAAIKLAATGPVSAEKVREMVAAARQSAEVA